PLSLRIQRPLAERRRPACSTRAPRQPGGTAARIPASGNLRTDGSGHRHGPTSGITRSTGSKATTLTTATCISTAYSPLPTNYPTRHHEIAAKLEQELRQHYRCGDYLPAEQQLAARFQVNRHTLRRAIDQLVEKGWVQRRQGVGVLVLMRPFDYPLNA